KEKENWVYKGAGFLYPDYNRCLIRLSRGGADAVVTREFDVSTKSFVKDGFRLPEAKSFVSWRDKDSVYLGMDFGNGSMSKSGYPLISKLWKRGTKPEDAKIVFKGSPASVNALAFRIFSPDGHIDVIMENRSRFKRDIHIIVNGKPEKLAIPENSNMAGIIQKQLLVQLNSDWNTGGKTYKQGSVI
ncbi:MAG: S9 family peptidase, partial [bacterium]|nr:S9 family peptidase [bacterium]